MECAFLVYSPITGALVAKKRLYEGALGIKTAALSPNGMYLAVGLYDQSLRLFSPISWRQVLSCAHSQPFPQSTPLLYREAEYRDPESRQVSTHYLVEETLTLTPLQVPPDTPNPPIGISLCVWSFDSHYLATRNDSTPNLIYIWDLQTLSLHSILIHQDPVKAVVWAPNRNVLALSSAQDRVFVWTETGASVCDVPLETGEFRVGSLQWDSRGESLLLMDKATLMVAFTQFEAGE